MHNRRGNVEEFNEMRNKDENEKKLKKKTIKTYISASVSPRGSFYLLLLGLG